MSSPMEGIENFNSPDPTYQNVWFKKEQGTLVVGSKQLEFHSKQHKQQQQPFIIPWKNVLKHQVSPANHPRSLLKLVLNSSTNNTKANSCTFLMMDRPSLERIRNEITNRLQQKSANDHTTSEAATNRKRSFTEFNNSSSAAAAYGSMDPTAVAVARSALLAANPAIRQQHKYLVTETNTVSEDDFWKTHHHSLEDEYARIAGLTQAGNPSVMQSHLPSSGKVTLGVQEMRQIFILYPAVHKAFEEMVPLELSEEQFWRKYLESEYFHRDRGRRGTVARNHAPHATQKETDKTGGPTYEQQEARAAAVGADDMFSRYDQKLQEVNSAKAQDSAHRKWGTRLAVGQFDLASTFETERGKLLEGPKDNHPPNLDDNEGKGARVIRKYNRHWAMVLHPQEAIAGADLADASRRSSRDVLAGNRDAFVMGGVDAEMRRLVDLADASEDDVNHAIGLSIGDVEYEPLTLTNIEAYHSKQTEPTASGRGGEDEAKMHHDFAVFMAQKTKDLVKSLLQDPDNIGKLRPKAFPPTALGQKLLAALTKRMAQDSKTEAQSLEFAKQLPDEIREQLQVYFRRSSELLRHFFGLRQMEGGADSQKMDRIVRGMKTLYSEIYENRENKKLGIEAGEIMRKMSFPIMDQLNSAFKLHNERSGGGGGGFVTVD